MLISKSERFLKEYNEFKDNISKIENDEVKKELNLLLDKLVAEVKSIDRLHENLLLTRRLATDDNGKRETVLTLRKKISQRLEEYKKQGLLNS